MLWSLLVRLRRIALGKLGALVGRMENPEEQLAVFAAELEARVQQLQRAVGTALADEKRMERQLQALAGRSAEWEQRALDALAQGREDLARAALAEQEQSSLELERLRVNWEEQRRASAALLESLKQARGQTDEARRRYNLLLARQRSAEAQQALRQVLQGGANGDAPAQLLARLEERIERAEAETTVQLQLAGELDASLEGEFRTLESERRTDAALARLKERLAPARELPPGAPGGPRSE